MSGTFTRSAARGSKDDTTPPSTITALTSGAFGAAIGGKGLTSGIKKLVSESQHDSEDDSGTASGDSSGDESESSDSSMTRVEQQDSGKKTSGDLMRHKAQESADLSKKPRAKVNANNIISDFSSPMRSFSGFGDGGTDRMEVRSELARSGDSAINARRLWNKAQTVLEEPAASQYKRSHPDAFSFQPSRQAGRENNVSFAARSDVSRNSDSSSRRAPRSQTTIDAEPYYQRDSHYQHDVRSELVSRRDVEQTTTARAKIRATISDQNAFPYQEAGYLANPHSTSRATLPRSPNGRPKAWSDVVYQPPETQTEVSRISDPGPRVTAGRPTIRVAARHNDHADGYYDGQPTHSETGRKPKVSLSAMMDVTNVSSQGDKPRRRVTQSAQMSIVDEGSEAEVGEGSDTEDSEEGEVSADESVLDEDEEMLLFSADPEIQRKFRELKISNKSLSSQNAKLASTVREQEAKTKTMESVAAVQHQQSDSISKMEELLREMSGKLSEQETEISKLKVEGETKPKTRMALFMDPRSLPLNSLPRIIFERAYDDIIILFTVVTSLMYTIYIFPLIVMARSTKQLADKGQARFLQLAEEMHLFDVQSPTAVAENSNTSSSTSTSSSANPDKSS